MMHVVVCGYRAADTLPKCLDSIFMQTYKDVNVQVVIDGAAEWWPSDIERFLFTDRIEFLPVFKRGYLLESTLAGIHECEPEDDDIIVLVDADDFLCDEAALEIVRAEYAKPETLLTYGSYCTSDGTQGKFNGAYQSGESVRTSPWRASHLKTFRYKLLAEVPADQLLRNDGTPITCAADRSLMIPMMELAGLDRCRHIETILYCYNDTNPLAVWATQRIESKTIRAELSARPSLPRKDFA